MDYCDLIITISTLACWMSEDKTADEVTQLSAIYLQLGKTLETIAIQKTLCAKDQGDNVTDIIL